MPSFWSSSLTAFALNMKLLLRRPDGLSELRQDLFQLLQHLQRVIVSLSFSRLSRGHNLGHHAFLFGNGGTYDFVVCNQVVVRALALFNHAAALPPGIGHQSIALLEQSARVADLLRECRAETCNCICQFFVLNKAIAKQPATPLPHLVDAIDNVLKRKLLNHAFLPWPQSDQVQSCLQHSQAPSHECPPRLRTSV